MYNENDKLFWQHQAIQSAAEIARLRTALREKTELCFHYENLLDSYRAAVKALLLEGTDEH